MCVCLYQLEIQQSEGMKNKRRLQTLPIDNAWSNKNFLYYLTFCLSMDNVCNRRLFSIPSKVEMAEEQKQQSEYFFKNRF